jgi:zinc and cadmium transporter
MEETSSTRTIPQWHNHEFENCHAGDRFQRLPLAMNSIFSSPTSVLVGYCILALLAALAGGVLPTLFKLTHARLQIAISFVAGLMLGLSLLGLLPHASHELNSVHKGAAWLLGGFLMMFFLQRFLPFHHHNVAEGSPEEPCGHAPSLAERSARGLTWMGVALGLSLHSIFDGLAMAAAVASDTHEHGGALGFGRGGKGDSLRKLWPGLCRVRRRSGCSC